jgi:hypothetical protein
MDRRYPETSRPEGVGFVNRNSVGVVRYHEVSMAERAVTCEPVSDSDALPRGNLTEKCCEFRAQGGRTTEIRRVLQ